MSAVIETTQTQPLSLLTPKQLAFVNHFIETKNGTQAAKLAGYAGNDVTLAVVAYENLRKPQIVSALNARLQAFQIGADEVLAELGQIARFPLEKCGTEDSPVKTTDKLKALDMAGKYLQLWDKPQQEASLTPESIELIGQSLLSAMQEAAARKRLSEGESQVIDVQAE